MKKIITLVFLMLVFSLNSLVLNADCESDKNDAEMVFYEVAPIYNDNGQIDIYLDMYGLTEELSVKIFNDFENQTHTYTYDDVDEFDGALGTIVSNVNREINYKVEIFSNSCGVEPIKSYDSQVKKVNVYAFDDVCKNEQYKSDLCKADADIDTDKMTIEEFRKKVKKEIKNYDFKINIRTSVKRYYLFVLIPMLIVIIYFVVRIILLKREKNKKMS